MKKNNIKNRKEKEELSKRWKGEEDYFEWYGRILESDNPEDKLCTESFPHIPFYTTEEKLEDYGVLDRKKYSYSFFPWREEIRPGDIMVSTDPSFPSTPILYIDKLRENDKVWRRGPLQIHPLHYSLNSKVWEWDWQRTLELNRELNKSVTSFDLEMHNLPKRYLKMALEEMRSRGIQSRIINKKEEDISYLRLRLNKKKYLKFREGLLELSKKGLKTRYDYEEIRNILTDSPTILIN